ncbi:MAG: hypothetical protein ACK4TB_04285 [Gemmobacter sp.]
MTATHFDPKPDPAPLWWRAIRAIPVIGWIVRDIERDFGNFWYLLVAGFSLLVIAVATWGVQILALVALCAVPVMFVILVLLTRG